MNLLHPVIDSIEEAIVIVDDAGKILLFNKAAARLNKELVSTGLQKGMYLWEATHPERKETVKEIIDTVRVGQHSYRTFVEFENPSGATSYLDFNYQPILNGEEKLTHVCLVIRDISQQKVFEKKLTTQVRNTRRIIEKANAAIIGLDTRGYVTEWNEYCEKVTGFSSSEILGWGFASLLLSGLNAQPFEQLMTQTLAGQVLSNVPLKLRIKTGKVITLLVNSTPLESDQRSTIGIMLVGQDITELTEYRESLERLVEERTSKLRIALANEKKAVEVKSRFVSVASHEFKMPLNSIQHAATYVRSNRHRISDLEFNDKLNNIEKQILHMEHLLDDVLAYGRTETAKIRVQTADLHLRSFLVSLINDVLISTERSHHIIAEYLNLPELIKIDESLLRKILTNLLVNAIKYSPGKGKIHFTVMGFARSLTLTVRDDGLGIEARDIETIFEPFVRSHQVSGIPGTGLGLSIVKRAVELLDGHIDVTSTPGKGSTFVVTLPNEPFIE